MQKNTSSSINQLEHDRYTKHTVCFYFPLLERDKIEHCGITDYKQVL